MHALFFTSPVGLGHATRDAAVACGRLEGRVKFVTGGAAARFMRGAGLPVLDAYAPPRLPVEDGELRHPLRWLLRYYRYYRECRGIAAEVIGRESPDVVVSDEDFASLAVAQGRGIPSVLITDVLETRFCRGAGSLVERRMNGAMRGMISRCDAVVVPERGPDEGNVRRTGPIVRGTGSSREDLRRRLGFGGRTILITAGGTGAGSFLIEAALRAAREAGEGCDVVVAAGPSIGGEFAGARNLGFVRDLHEVIYASDLVISLAGKSTIDEANAYGTPGIFIPIKGHFEQEDNARAEGFSHGDARRLGPIIREKIRGPRGRPAPAGGARGARDAIMRAAGARAGD